MIKNPDLPEINKELRLGQIETCKEQASITSAMTNTPALYDTIMEECIDGLTESIKGHDAATP